MQAKEFFKVILRKKAKIFLPTIVWAETLTVLEHQKHEDLNRINLIMSELKRVNLDEEVVKQVLKTLQQQRADLKTSDLVIAVTAKQEGAKLVTWDKQLLTRGKGICEVVRPEEVEE